MPVSIETVNKLAKIAHTCRHAQSSLADRNIMIVMPLLEELGYTLSNGHSCRTVAVSDKCEGILGYALSEVHMYRWSMVVMDDLTDAAVERLVSVAYDSVRSWRNRLFKHDEYFDVANFLVVTDGYEYKMYRVILGDCGSCKCLRSFSLDDDLPATVASCLNILYSDSCLFNWNCMTAFHNEVVCDSCHELCEVFKKTLYRYFRREEGQYDDLTDAFINAIYGSPILQKKNIGLVPVSEIRSTIREVYKEVYATFKDVLDD